MLRLQTVQSSFQISLLDNSVMESINSLNNPPPAPLHPNDLFIRRCRLAGDEIDAYRGCFRTDFLPKLLELTNGAPMLVGHQKNGAPIGRFFGGSIVSCETPEGSANYISPHFYWPVGCTWSNDLRLLVDSGIYNEASISFVFHRATCSVCGKDIRGCPHYFKLINGDPEVFYYYDNVERVLEGSIVYRGAEPGTGFDLWHSGTGKDNFTLPGQELHGAEAHLFT